MTIRVLVADDHELVRSGFATILGVHPDLAVVGEAADGEQAVAEVERLRPDVVLMDVRMPVLDGIEATRRVRGRTKVLILTTFDLDEYVYEGLRAGASGFLLKDVGRDELARAVRVVAAGEALLAPTATRRLIERFVGTDALPPPSSPKVLDPLTMRERDVLTLLARGGTNAEIARSLGVGDETVKSHVARILMKLHLRDRVQAVIFAYEHGIVRSGER